MATAHIDRQLSVHFSTKFIKGISHTDILSQLEQNLDRKVIKAIQITESQCVITVSDRLAKLQLQVKGIDFQNHHIRIHDVEKEVTNVTIKDAPVELGDDVICAHMQQYGEVVQGSLRRGTIKGTDIETGTRYIQLLNCTPIIPNITKFGRFNVRLFADNNRTKCKHCEQTDHPAFKCPSKTVSKEIKRKCYRCNSPDHVIQDCPFPTKVCFTCKQVGHMKRECPQEYGEYIHEIIEGRQALNNSVRISDYDENSCETQDLTTNDDRQSRSSEAEPRVQRDEAHQNTKSSFNKRTVKAVVLGASNYCKVKVTNPDIMNISVSGSTAEEVDQLLRTAENKVNCDKVEKVIFGLGTNDVSREKTDSDLVKVHMTNALTKVKNAFPNAEIGLCNIIPRRGKGINQTKCNLTASTVNSFNEKMCNRDPKLHYIDLWSEFSKHNIPIKYLYDVNDPSGVHISHDGAKLLNNIFEEYVDECNTDDFSTPSRKRTRSDTKTPGSAEKQLDKMQKHD